MLFSYKIFTFSQLPNKFHYRKFQYINLKQTKPNKNQNEKFVNTKISVKRREGGRESDRQVRERERSGMGGSCGSELMEEGSELLDVDRSRWCRCAISVVLGWTEHSSSRGWDEDRDRGFDGAISLSLCLRVCESFFLSLFLSLRVSENGLKWKKQRKIFYSPLPLFYGQHWKHFQFDPIFSNNQTPTFTEKHFRKLFEAKTNAPLVMLDCFVRFYSLEGVFVKPVKWHQISRIQIIFFLWKWMDDKLWWVTCKNVK